MPNKKATSKDIKHWIDAVKKLSRENEKYEYGIPLAPQQMEEIINLANKGCACYWVFTSEPYLKFELTKECPIHGGEKDGVQNSDKLLNRR